MDQNFQYYIFVGIGFLVGIPFILALSSYLWNKKWRPMQQGRGKVVDKFGNIMSRARKFIFKEDSITVPAKIKSPFLRKLFTIKKIYFAFLVVTLVMIGMKNSYFIVPVIIMFMVMFVRTNAVFRQRHDILLKMFEVAASEFRYPRGADMEPRKFITIESWINKVTPEKTVISYPLAFKSDSIMNRESFEKHFNASVTDKNMWDYEWEPTKPLVICKPVDFLPEKSDYEGSTEYPWDIFPVGAGLRGPVTYNVSKTPHILVCGPTGSGKSVLQRNILFHCIQHNDMWRFLGVDVKRVELSPYAKYKNTVLGIGTSLEDGAEIVAYAKKQMEERYEHMESVQVNHFLDLPKDANGKLPYYAILLMIDEAFMFMGMEGNKTDEGKARDELHGQASSMLGDIARLGRAAGVHLVIATQRPDATVIKGELKANLDTRIAAGRLNSVSSSMILDSMEGTLLPGHIRGRGAISISGTVEQFQGYFAGQEWIDEWLAKPENRWREPQLFDDDPTNDLLNLDDLESQIPGIGEEVQDVLDEAKFEAEVDALPVAPVQASPAVSTPTPPQLSKPAPQAPPAPSMASPVLKKSAPVSTVPAAPVPVANDEALITPESLVNSFVFDNPADKAYAEGNLASLPEDDVEVLETEEEYLRRILMPEPEEKKVMPPAAVAKPATVAVVKSPVAQPQVPTVPSKPSDPTDNSFSTFPKRPSRPTAQPKRLDIDYDF